jgi:hypothetical protein
MIEPNLKLFVQLCRNKNYMKQFFTILCILFFFGQIHAQNNVTNAAQTSPGSGNAEMEDDKKDAEEQSLEKQQTVKGATFWMKKYETKRKQYCTPYDRNISTPQQQSLDNILFEMEQEAPNTFEYNYAMYLNANYNIQAVNYLKTAYAINPNRPEIYDDFMAYYELTNDVANRKNFSKKLYASNTIASDVMSYNYNVLMSVEKDAVLFTNGETDTYPLWIWQDVKSVRKDVTVLNFNLMSKQHYLDQKSRSLSMQFPKATVLQNNPTLFYKQFCSMNSNRPVYFGLTIAPAYIGSITNYLYVTGLTYKFSVNDFDNYKTTYNNWNKHFTTDYIINKNYSSAVHINYLIPMLIIYDYEKNGVKKQTLLHLINDMAKTYNKEKQVKQYMSR